MMSQRRYSRAKERRIHFLKNLRKKVPKMRKIIRSVSKNHAKISVNLSTKLNWSTTCNNHLSVLMNQPKSAYRTLNHLKTMMKTKIRILMSLVETYQTSPPTTQQTKKTSKSPVFKKHKLKTQTMSAPASFPQLIWESQEVALSLKISENNSNS